jgi:Mn-dependent DtxR family transcriptional regulator
VPRLLETALRKGENRFGLTQEFLADMLGVRRQSVNLTARLLQSAKLIEYRRGNWRSSTGTGWRRHRASASG